MTVRGDGAITGHPSSLMVWTVVGAGVTTIAVVVLPDVGSPFSAPTLRVMLETVDAVAAALVGFLVYGRFRQGRRLQDLLLGLALVAVAVANMVLTALPDALADGHAQGLDRWAPLAVRLVGTVLFAGAALAPARSTLGRRSAAAIAGGTAAVLVGIGVAGALWGDRLPAVVRAPLLGSDGTASALVAHPVALGAQVLGVVLYGVAAAAFARHARRVRDELVRWVAAGCVLASASGVHYVLFPSLYSEYLYSGDVLRLGFYTAMLVGAAREITTLWRAKAQTAVLEDRRRIARDLHDGLIQELAYIYAQSQRLSARPGDEVAVTRIAGAATRAVDESRRALAALARPDDEPFPLVLENALDEMASRYDVKIVTALDHDAETDAPIAEALLRIAGEAVRNAVRHGGAQRIEVRLAAVPLSLTVTDDGCGFEADLPKGGRAGGFGLRSMRERAAGIGASLALESGPGEGTTVRVSWV